MRRLVMAAAVILWMGIGAALIVWAGRSSRAESPPPPKDAGPAPKPEVSSPAFSSGLEEDDWYMSATKAPLGGVGGGPFEEEGFGLRHRHHKPHKDARR